MLFYIKGFAMKTLQLVLAFSFLFLAIIACGFFPAPATEVTPTASALPIVTEMPTVAPRKLTICLGQEPETLYPIGKLNAAARTILTAVYDGPYDTRGYEYQPVALLQLPSLKNGDAQIIKATVEAGDQIIDADGNLVTLAQGIRVRPANCRTDGCSLTYDGVTPLELDQMVVSFRMRDDLTWSDGTPITAEDSVYAYTIAADPNTDTNKYLTDRTQVYEAADAQTIQWWGKPGFIDPDYVTNFFAPAPKHAWSSFTPGELPEVDIASHSPMGWGPYMIQEWVAGDHITLKRNPYYFRAAEGLPKIDDISFRFIADPDVAISELVAGRCDIIDPTIRLDGHIALLQELQKSEQAKAFFTPGMTIEWLGLGITPASYEDGYNINLQVDRADFFGDAHTRQGIVYCLDRKSVVDNVLFGLTSVPTTYIPAEHPLYDTNVDTIPFDPAVGISLLEQAGWRDTDGDPATPRLAVTVKNIKPGTPLQLNYYTTTATQRRQVVNILEASLAQCGIGVEVKYFSQTDLYAPGPDGFLFGRKFDLIEYAMGVDGIVPPCNWFTSKEIPKASNQWIGTNLTGYTNPEYDSACHTTQLSLPEEQKYVEAYRQTQIIFGDELPAIPLYYRLRIAATRPDLCNFELDPTANPLWNIEEFDLGEACQN
jgi:peptide/nickel transport system substrate-binding protein